MQASAHAMDFSPFGNATMNVASTNATNAVAGRPSKVLHANGLPADTGIDDALVYLSAFGKVEFVCLLAKNQALIELDSVHATTSALLYSQSRPLYSKQQIVTLSFSRSVSINRANHPNPRTVTVGPYNTLVARAVTVANRNANAAAAGAGATSGAAGVSGSSGSTSGRRAGNNEHAGNGAMPTNRHQQSAQQNQSHQSGRILLLSIMNPVYSISCGVLHQIMSPYGNVLRIVVFMKTGLQAMVEFDNEASATAALRSLDGRDIYEGSCTLKIVHSHADTLNVRHNDEHQRDYTRPDLPGVAGAQVMPFGVQMVRQAAAGAAAGGTTLGGVRTVVVVHGLRPDLTSDQVFNVFGNFGNIVRIKQLPHKQNVRLIQFADALFADAAVRHLNDAPLYDAKLDVRFSVHPAIIASPADEAMALADPSGAQYRDYTNSPLNRFRRNAAISAKIYCAPNETLHFTNMPPDADAESCFALFAARNAPAPMRVLLFENANATQRSGLVEFHSTADAMSAVVLCNNVTLTSGGLFKLSFTTNHIKLPHANNAATTTTTAATAASTADIVVSQQ